MANLKTNYKDDVLDTSKNEKRKFRMIQNEDGTVSFEDVTEYTQIGDTFGAADVNKANEEINALNEGSGCAYKGIQVIYKRNVDIVEGLYTSAWDGFVQGIAKTAANSGNPFIRLEINGSVIFEGSGVSKNYSYLWSPLFEVRKGDVIKYMLTSDTDDSNKELRIYLHRAR